jgi:hypothetical protein
MSSSGVEIPGSSNLDSEPNSLRWIYVAPDVAATCESYAYSDPMPILDPKTFNPISW